MQAKDVTELEALTYAATYYRTMSHIPFRVMEAKLKRLDKKGYLDYTFYIGQARLSEKGQKRYDELKSLNLSTTTTYIDSSNFGNFVTSFTYKVDNNFYRFTDEE